MFDSEKCFRCHKRFKFEELSPGPDGFSVCTLCESELAANNKLERRCPDDDQRLRSDFASQFIISTCDKCGGVWVSGTEIEKLSAEMSVRHYQYKAADFADALLKMVGRERNQS